METLQVVQETRKCQECGAKLVGRSDQKFCDQMCKTAYNNRRRTEEAKMQPECIMKIQKRLLNNYKILCDLRKQGEQFNKTDLQELGFSFRYMTAVINQGSVLLYYCFNQPYILTDEKLILFAEGLN